MIEAPFHFACERCGVCCRVGKGRVCENRNCSLLEGMRDCLAYSSRPELGRSYPSCPELLAGGIALQATATWWVGLYPNAAEMNPSGSDLGGLL